MLLMVLPTDACEDNPTIDESLLWLQTSVQAFSSVMQRSITVLVNGL